MIVLVLSMHAVDTYSPFGSWYFTDRRPMPLWEVVAFSTYQSTLQDFFMALLFLIAGAFAAGSYDRKGFAGFVRERCARLGLPTLLFMFVIGPLTEYYLSRTWGAGGFGHQWWVHLRNGQWAQMSGPMWFCAALLALSLAYALLRQAELPKLLILLPDDARGDALVAGLMLAMATATFLVRTAIPQGRSILNMHPGDFPQYIAMFAVGVAADRNSWFTVLPKRLTQRWGRAAAVLAVPTYLALILWGGALHGRTIAYGGGLNPVSAARCLWEAFTCVGLSLLVLDTFRRHFSRQGPIARMLSANAFAVYLIHPPVLILLARVQHGLSLDPIVMALLLTLTTGAASLLVCAAVLRRTPVFRSIL